MYLSLHCHHQNDSCIKMGSDERRFKVSLIVRDKVTRQCPQTTTFEEKGEGRWGYGGGGRERLLYLSLHCHHQNDSCIKMGGDQSHFNVSLIVRDKVARQSPQTKNFEEKGEQKRIRTEVLPLTSLKPVLNWANVSSRT